jgi:peptide/nickel transport system substrate-binding protein
MRAFNNGVRAAATLATAGALLAGCGSSPISAHSSSNSRPSTNYAYGSLPKQQGVPVAGGTVSLSEPPGAGPTYIFPVTPGAQQSVYNDFDFQNLMWRPLWWSPKGVSPTIDYTQSLAPYPKFTNHNKTVTITMDPNWKWSDGQPVTSQDISFFYWLLKAAVKISPANFGDYTPGLFPDNISSVSTPNARTLVFNFTRSYNANFDFLEQLNVLVPLPAHAWSETSANGPIIPFDNLTSAEAIYKFLASQSTDPKSYGTNPIWQVVDGPYKIQSFDPATGANVLVANTAYSGPAKPHITTVAEDSFTSSQAEFNQLLTGKLDVGQVPLADLPQVPALRSKGYSVYGYPDFGFSYIAYNFKDKTDGFNHVIGQLYMRQALARLQDEQAEIKSRGVFDGAGGEAYGAVPAAPAGPFTPANALVNPYPFSISKASHILSSHGWDVVPNGTTTCQRPGGAANQCGPGIAKGTALSWNLFYANNSPLTQAIDEAWVSNLSQVGIQVKLIAKTFNFILQNYDDPSAPKNDNVWNMIDFGGFTDDYYPTTNELFNTTGSFNTGGFSNPALDAAILNSEFSLNSLAVDKELSLVTKLQPGLFQPNEDRIYAFKNGISGPPTSFSDATQEQWSPEYWYFTKS